MLSPLCGEPNAVCRFVSVRIADQVFGSRLASCVGPSSGENVFAADGDAPDERVAATLCAAVPVEQAARVPTRTATHIGARTAAPGPTSNLMAATVAARAPSAQ